MSDATEIIRLRQENDRLRAENAQLRPLVSDLSHRLSVLTRHHDHEHHPHDVATAPTEAIISPARTHG